MNKRNKRRLDVLERVAITAGGQVSQNRAELSAIVRRLNNMIERVGELEKEMKVIEVFMVDKES